MKRVLVVDDAMFMRSTIKNILLKNDFEVIGEASNGMAAVTLFRELNPDIVTLDVTMPIMNGLSALKAIIEIDPEASCVVLSAMGQQEIVKEAILAGAKGFIVKPFHEETVVRALEAL